MELDSQWASQLTVVDRGNEFDFYIWDQAFVRAEKVMTLFVHSTQTRSGDQQETDKFVLYENDTTAFMACLTDAAQGYQITQDQVIDSFHLIKQEWKTGER